MANNVDANWARQNVLKLSKLRKRQIESSWLDKLRLVKLLHCKFQDFPTSRKSGQCGVHCSSKKVDRRIIGLCPLGKKLQQNVCRRGTVSFCVKRGKCLAIKDFVHRLSSFNGAYEKPQQRQSTDQWISYMHVYEGCKSHDAIQLARQFSNFAYSCQPLSNFKPLYLL